MFSFYFWGLWWCCWIGLRFLIFYFLVVYCLFHDLPTFFFLSKIFPPHLMSVSSSQVSLSIFHSHTSFLPHTNCLPLRQPLPRHLATFLAHSEEADRELTYVCHRMLCVSYLVFMFSCSYLLVFSQHSSLLLSEFVTVGAGVGICHLFFSARSLLSRHGCPLSLSTSGNLASWTQESWLQRSVHIRKHGRQYCINFTFKQTYLAATNIGFWLRDLHLFYRDICKLPNVLQR